MIGLISCNQISAQEIQIKIQDYPADFYEPEIDLESHKSGDVEIHQVKIPKEGYLLIFFHDYSGKVQNYHSYKFDTTSYDQGFYNWRNDTTVRIKLFNSKTKNEWSVEVGITGGDAFMRLLE